MNLYFIALLPGDELRDRVRKLKEEMKLRFGAAHALKSPAHITLQIPFKRYAEDEVNMSRHLSRFVHNEKPFRVDLSGFGSFIPRVIFIKVKDPVPVTDLFKRLRGLLTEHMGFSSDEVMKRVEPHMTIATRDLKSEIFAEAWDGFKNRDFTDSFEVKSIFLLRHNGKCWDILREFEFGCNE